jgi:hypothetical protein
VDSTATRIAIRARSGRGDVCPEWRVRRKRAEIAV